MVETVTSLLPYLLYIIWTDSTIVQSATTIVSRTSRSTLRSMNGLPISDIFLTRDSTCQRNVACAAGLSSWCECLKPGLACLSHLGTRTAACRPTHTSYIVRRRLIDFVQRGLPASHAGYVNCVLSTLIIV